MFTLFVEPIYSLACQQKFSLSQLKKKTHLFAPRAGVKVNVLVQILTKKQLSNDVQQDEGHVAFPGSTGNSSRLCLGKQVNKRLNTGICQHAITRP